MAGATDLVQLELGFIFFVTKSCIGLFFNVPENVLCKTHIIGTIRIPSRDLAVVKFVKLPVERSYISSAFLILFYMKCRDPFPSLWTNEKHFANTL